MNEIAVATPWYVWATIGGFVAFIAYRIYINSKKPKGGSGGGGSRPPTQQK